MLAGGGSTQGSGIVTGPEGLPWPAGDPDQLRTTAQHAVGLAEEAERKRASLLESGRDVNPWSGMAHQTYVANLERHATGADKMASGLRETSSGLMGLAGTMQQAQELIRRLAERLGDAREQARRAAQRAEQARAEAAAARQRAMATAPVTGGADPAAQEAQAAEDSAQQAEAEAARAQQHAQDVERQCQAQAEQACDDVRRQDQQSSNAIEAMEWLPYVPGLALGKAEAVAKHLSKTPKLLPDQAMRQTAAKWATRFKVAGSVLAFGGGFGAQWLRDARRHPNMETDERIGRAAAEGVSAAAGAAAGAFIGTLLLPGAGTIVGGMIGGAVGGWLATHFNDPAVKAVGNFSDKAGDWVGDKLGQAKEAIGKTWDNLTPW